jgi:hypothetical protein
MPHYTEPLPAGKLGSGYTSIVIHHMDVLAMRTLLVVALASVLGACAGTTTTPDDEFSQLAAQIEREIRAAEQTGFLWRDTERLLRDARSAQKEGRHDDARKLANRALKQAQLAQQQARAGANAGPRYPKSP